MDTNHPDSSSKLAVMTESMSDNALAGMIAPHTKLSTHAERTERADREERDATMNAVSREHANANANANGASKSNGATKHVGQVNRASQPPAKHDIDVPETPAAPAALESGVFLAPDLAPNTDVTLVVYSWHNVQPGTLSWIFPTVRAAVSAAYAMKNAIRWAVVRGHIGQDDLAIDRARGSGLVMIENC